MRKYVLLLLIVLAVSANAWAGYTSLSLTVKAINDSASGTLRFTGPSDAKICIDPIKPPCDKCFSVKIFVDCDDCSCRATRSFCVPINFGSKLCPGKYTVSVEIYCRCHKCCKDGCPKRIATLTSSFTISSKGSSTSSSSSSSFSSSSSSSSSSSIWFSLIQYSSWF
jgi:hypothetical protein